MTQTQQALDLIGFATQTLMVVFVFLIAPFCQSWRRTMAYSTIPSAVWAAIRLITIIRFGESSPPLMGFLVLPLFAFIFSALLRLLRIGIQKICAALRGVRDPS